MGQQGTAHTPDTRRRPAPPMVADDDRLIPVPLSKALEAAIEQIHAEALKEATAPSTEDDEVIFSSKKTHRVPMPKGSWSPQERAILEGMYKHYHSCAAAYRDNPIPVGKDRSDISAWLRLFQSAIPTGRHRETLKRMPQWNRHMLETARTSGGEVLLPHVAHGDTLPRELRVENIARRFGIDLMQAADFQLYFMILEFRPEVIDHYATQVRKTTLPQLFKAEDLAKDPGVHPGILLIQLSRLAAALLELDPSDEDAMEQAVTPHYDTDVGQYDGTIREFENDGEPPEETDLVFVDAGEGEDELLEEEEEALNAEGAIEAIAYHKVGKGDVEPDPLEDDPLYHRIRHSTAENIAPLKKHMFAIQKDGSDTRPPLIWSHLWLLVKAREADFVTTNRTLAAAKKALAEALDFRQVSRLGRRMFAASKQWPSHARKAFWTEYNRRKAELAPRAA